MKTFLKSLLYLYCAFFIAFYIGAQSYIKDNDIKLEDNIGFGFAENINLPNAILSKLETKPVEIKEHSTLEEAYDKSSRVNFF